jgi:type IV secretory pathway TraG/TraD family ATPase VirD4
MFFKPLSPTKAVMAKTRLHLIARVFFSCLFACMLLIVMVGIAQHTYSEVFMYSTLALLWWHFTFAKRQVTFDLQSQQITTKISSLYLLTQQVIPIRNIAALQLRSRASSSNGGRAYELLIVMHTQTEPLKFEYGGLYQMQSLGKQIADFCNIPFINQLD